MSKKPTSRPPASQRRVPAAPRGAAKPSGSVDDLLAAAAHPLISEIQQVRAIMLGIDPTIVEAVKWNTASYRTSDFFAAIHLRSRDQVQLVFHTGAKVKATAVTGITVADPAGLCAWLAKDRCLVSLGTGKQFTANRPAFEALVREWITWL